MARFNLFKRWVSGAVEERRDQPRLQAALGSRVLVVDDSATIRAVLNKMLMQDGYDVLKAADGESAIELARSEQPDLIFLDIVLPGMSGFAVLRCLRRDATTRHIPIVMISGNVQATEQFYVQRFGADDFMKKPFGRSEVFERIRSLVQAGRMVPRDPDAQPAPAPVSELEAAAWQSIPEIAMPDPEPPEPPVPSDVATDTGHVSQAPAQQVPASSVSANRLPVHTVVAAIPAAAAASTSPSSPAPSSTSPPLNTVSASPAPANESVALGESQNGATYTPVDRQP